MAPDTYQQQYMDGIQPSQPHLQGLPLELMNLIFQHLEKKELKSLRLASSEFQDVTTILLFKRYTLYPHQTSFERLLAIANQTSLSDSIQELEINTAFRALPRVPPRYLVPPLPGQYNESRKVSKKAKNRKSPDHVAKVTAALRGIFSNTFAGGNTSDELSQMVFLQRIFPRLSSLQRIRITDAFFDVDLPHFYLSQLPDFCNSSTKDYSALLQDYHDDENVQQSYAFGVLAAARDVSSLRNFVMHGLDWEDLFGMPDLFRRPILYRDTLARLEHLELTTEMGKHHWDGDVTLNLQAMLKLSPNLQVLILWFRRAEDADVGGETLYDWSYNEHCKSNFQLDLDEHDGDFEGPIEMPARLTWSSKVRKLELRGLICTSGEMQSVLGHCSRSLKSLDLSDVILVPNPRTGPRACFVKLFKWMQQHLRLEALRLQGFFTNGGMQAWSFSDESEHQSADEELKAKVLGFVLHGAACPLDHVEIPDDYFDLGKPRYRREAPATLTKDTKYKGDESLHMEYHDHEEVPSDEEDEEDEEDESSDYDTDDPDNEIDGEDNEWESASSEDSAEDTHPTANGPMVDGRTDGQ